jgi:2-polyprenyl-3-methyl-5-hydroxy-6-metoxy-1,4-benzoquinol methylase
MATLPYGKLLSAEAYATAYSAEQGFEATCIEARQQSNAAFLRDERPETILEVGCGHRLLSAMPEVTDIRFRRWAVIEPALHYAEGARSATAADGRFSVVQGYVEACGDELRSIAPGGYDTAIVSGLVHETTEPLGLLTAVEGLIRPGGKILVSAPNALSFHRLLAVQCDLLASPYELSAIDLKLGHAAVFDPRSLADLVTRAGFANLQSGGFLFKPFTNAQMQAVINSNGLHLVAGLISLGRRFPDNAAEIYVTGQKL